MQNVGSVYLTRKLPDPALQYLKESCALKLWNEEQTPVPRDVLLKQIDQVEGIYCTLSDKIDREIISSSPNLRVISTMSVGYDHIDVQFAREQGIKVTYTPGVLTETTADLAFTLLMSTSRRIFEANRSIYEGKWKGWAPLFMAGRDIYGAKLGIVGMGRIGKAMVRRAKGFNMKISYYSRSRKKEMEQQEGITYKPLEVLLQESDFISLHLPGNSDTYHLIDTKELALMKPTAILINTARGSVVNEKALLAALQEDRIRGAGLDVFEREPVDPKHPLLALPNVLALPHIGSASVETRFKMAMIAAEDLVKGLQGETPQYEVTES